MPLKTWKNHPQKLLIIGPPFFSVFYHWTVKSGTEVVDWKVRDSNVPQPKKSGPAAFWQDWLSKGLVSSKLTRLVHFALTIPYSSSEGINNTSAKIFVSWSTWKWKLQKGFDDFVSLIQCNHISIDNLEISRTWLEEDNLEAMIQYPKKWMAAKNS